jgi:hypothetical protein
VREYKVTLFSSRAMALVPVRLDYYSLPYERHRFHLYFRYTSIVICSDRFSWHVGSCMSTLFQRLNR